MHRQGFKEQCLYPSRDYRKESRYRDEVRHKGSSLELYNWDLMDHAMDDVEKYSRKNSRNRIGCWGYRRMERVFDSFTTGLTRRYLTTLIDVYLAQEDQPE